MGAVLADMARVVEFLKLGDLDGLVAEWVSFPDRLGFWLVGLAVLCFGVWMMRWFRNHTQATRPLNSDSSRDGTSSGVNDSPTGNGGAIPADKPQRLESKWVIEIATPRHKWRISSSSQTIVNRRVA